jgi:hypothetical protein
MYQLQYLDAALPSGAKLGLQPRSGLLDARHALFHDYRSDADRHAGNTISSSPVKDLL